MSDLHELKMGKLRELGNELGVKASSKDELIAEIEEAQAQLKLAAETAPEVLLTETEFEADAEPEVVEAEVVAEADAEIVAEVVAAAEVEDAEEIEEDEVPVAELDGHEAVDAWIENHGNALIAQALPASSILMRFIVAFELPQNRGYSKIRQKYASAIAERRWNDLFHGAYELLK